MFFCKNRASGDNFQDLKSTTNESYNAAAAIEGLERMPDAFRGMIEQTKFVRTSLNWTLTHLRHMYMCPGAAIEYYGNIDIAICEMAHIPLERILSEKVRLAKHEI